MVERASSGVEDLDAVIEGGFPRGSLILLAGNPGTGKTVFSTQFLVRGAESGEPGVYVSFAESKDVLIENVSRHLGVDLKRLESQSKLKVLDMVAMKELGISAALEAILREVEAVKAKRLVIDSFSAMAQAFKEPIDVRIIVHTILSRLTRKMDCTTIMIEETPIGGYGVGLGLEEFVADGVIVLRAGELDGRLLRDLELVKLRGTELAERKLVFTLKGGFRAFPPFKPKPLKERKRFQPIKDSLTHFSTGCRELDELLGGGLPKGASVLLELSEKLSTLDYHLILLPIMLNFGIQGRGVLLIPSTGIGAELTREIALGYGATEDEINRLLRVYETPTPGKDQKKPYIAVIEGKDASKDYQEYLKLESKLAHETGQPVMSVAGADTLVRRYDEKGAESLYGEESTKIRQRKSLGIAIVKPGYEQLAQKLSSMVETHLRLLREHGCLLIYGIKPRTSLYAVEMDISKGYPLPRLTPIV